jgi:NAD(P)-dependent dehydrogenase (short-subunit alcohol dehydrogenase family)
VRVYEFVPAGARRVSQGPDMSSRTEDTMRNTTNAMPSFRLDGLTAIVTGASSGLGERFVRVLHHAGAIVVAVARRTQRLESLASELGSRVIPRTCDVAVDTQVDELVADIAQEAGGRVDVLVNNAGIVNLAAAEDELREDFRRVLDVNLNAVFGMSQAVGRVMLCRQSGSIVNVASMLGFVAGAPMKQASYCASKAGVINLTRELAVQWARKGVRVNAIAPGFFPSEMTADLFNNEKPMNFLRSNCPMGRGGEIQELDGALLYLARMRRLI